MAKNYQDLIAWQKAMELVEYVYRRTSGFPVDERFGLVSQMRPAAVSIPSNIAEGQPTGGATFRKHLDIAYGTLVELETQVEISKRLGFMENENGDDLPALMDEVGRLINGLKRSLR